VLSTGGLDAAVLMSAADDALYERRRRARDPRSHGRPGAAARYEPELPEVPADKRWPISGIAKTSTA
jgi:hypothetical protein